MAMATVTSLYAQKKTERNYQFDDDSIETVEAYSKENELPNKNFPKLFSLLDDRLAKIKNKSSYDYAMILRFKAAAYMEKTEYANAIEPLEQALTLSDAQNPTYFDEKVSSDICDLLARLYFQESATIKKRETIVQYLDKAEHYIDRWVKNTKKAKDDGLYIYATILYTRAVLDDKNIDKARIARAMELIDQCLHLATHPKDNLYILKLVCLQQLDRPTESAEIFELLLKNKPENKEYWKQLASTYQAMELPTKAIVTIERAQALGLLNTPADNYSLFGTYFNEGQFGQAAELLEKGFRDGTIDNTQLNWEFLSSCYQQLNLDMKAIDALKRASKRFPKDGQIDFMIGQNYYTIKKLDEALPYLQSSVSKGGGTKPAQTYILMAYIAFELKKLDIALEAANKAIALPDGIKEGTRFKKAVLDAIREREEKLKKM